jgi:hypothetical protein
MVKSPLKTSVARIDLLSKSLAGVFRGKKPSGSSCSRIDRKPWNNRNAHNFVISSVELSASYGSFVTRKIHGIGIKFNVVFDEN